MVIPSAITNFNRSPAELQEFAIYCVAAAGKAAEQQASKVNALIRPALLAYHEPFDYLQDLDRYGKLDSELRSVRIGQYVRIGKAVRGLIKNTPCLASASLPELESIYGIGPKTARFFLLHSRVDQEVAVLDVHILRFLRKSGVDAPLQTPQGKKYVELEQKFLELCSKAGMSPAELDLRVWNKERGSL